MKTRTTALQSIVILSAFSIPDGTARSQEDVVARSRAVYSALTSYSDAAAVETELRVGGAPPIRERHTFVTRFRKPRHFYFDFNEDKSAGGDRFVVWSDSEAFHTWWATTGVEQKYPQGQGAAALVAAFGITNGAAAMITPLLFPQANLKGGPLMNFEGGTPEGTEQIGERSCHRVKGVQRSVYSNTGLGEQVRETTLWIDAATFLLCRVFEDTPRGVPAGNVQRATTTFEPLANPELTDDKFRFNGPQN
jgi:hypothetical protein